MEKKSKMSKLLLADYEQKKKELKALDEDKAKVVKEKAKKADEKNSKKADENIKEDKAKAKKSNETEDKVSEADKVKKAVQKRIDELVAKNKQKDMQIASLNEKIASLELKKDESEISANQRAYKEALANLSELRKKMVESSDKGIDALVAKEITLLEEIGELRKKMEESKKSVSVDTDDKENGLKWSEGIKRAVGAFPDIFVEAESKFNVENPLYKKAIEFLTKDGQTPVYNKALAKGGFKLNPRFDHGDGFYAAVLEAANELKSAELKLKEKALEKESKSEGAKEQLLSGGLYPSAASAKDSKNAKLNDLREKMLSEGADSPAGIEYYRLIRTKA
nr:hypothetical protein 33 [bacterium]